MDFSWALGHLVKTLGSVRLAHWAKGECLVYTYAALDNNGKFLLSRDHLVDITEYVVAPVIIRLDQKSLREVWSPSVDEILSQEWQVTALPFNDDRQKSFYPVPIKDQVNACL